MIRAVGSSGLCFYPQNNRFVKFTPHQIRLIRRFAENNVFLPLYIHSRTRAYVYISISFRGNTCVTPYCNTVYAAIFRTVPNRHGIFAGSFSAFYNIFIPFTERNIFPIHHSFLRRYGKRRFRRCMRRSVRRRRRGTGTGRSTASLSTMGGNCPL